MRIGVNTLFYIPGEVGGSETYLRNTLRSMAKMFPEIGLVLFTNRENDPVLGADLSGYPQVKCRLLDFYASNRYMRIIREQVELPAKVRTAGVDVLWSPGYTAPVLSNCPQVTSILDMQYKRHPDDLSGLARLSTHILVTAAAKRSRFIVTLSEFSKKEITRFTKTAEHKIHPILLSAAPEFAGLAGEPHRNRLKAMDSVRPYILSVANSYPHKNLHTLVEAFGRIIHRIKHNLVLIGLSRRGEKMVQKSIDQISQRDRIIRIGRVDGKELIGWYRYADLFVFPSIYEGFGLPVLEAMTVGTLVVTTRMGSIPEVGGNHVIYADPPDARTFADRMIDVLNWEKNRRDDWTASAKSYASQFSWEETARKTLSVLKRAAVSRYREETPDLAL